MTDDFTIRHFDIREANWRYDERFLAPIRRAVFIKEQRVPAEMEWDGKDDSAWHWLATDPDKNPIGTARLLPDGQIGRMAVLPEHRNKGVGDALLEQAIGKAQRLGMDQVFLHAQTAVSEFYVKAGFTPEGEPFAEAGIEHILMTMAITLADESELSQLLRDAKGLDVSAVSIKQFDCMEADWARHGSDMTRIRKIVFIDEQQIPREIEQDGRDEESHHWLAFDLEGLVIGTARLLPDGQIGRMAVLPDYRGRGIGFSLLELAVGKARRLGFDEAYLHAQSSARGFYEKAGFKVRGEPFMEAGIAHIEMNQKLQIVDVDQERAETASVLPMPGDEYQADPSRKLGASNRVLLLRRQEAFKEVTLDIVMQTHLNLRIYSPLLDHRLYDDVALREAVSRLARRNKHTKIQILIYDSHRMVKNGHVLLELSRRLSSIISIKLVHEDYRQMNHEYVLADQHGIIYRLDHEKYEGYANYLDLSEVNRLGREFQRAWESALPDPNLRTLKI